MKESIRFLPGIGCFSGQRPRWRPPGGWNQLAIPVFPENGELLQFLRFLAGQVFLFTDVLLEVIKLGSGRAGWASALIFVNAATRGFDKLPISHSKRDLLAKTP